MKTIKDQAKNKFETILNRIILNKIQDEQESFKFSKLYDLEQYEAITKDNLDYYREINFHQYDDFIKDINSIVFEMIESKIRINNKIEFKSIDIDYSYDSMEKALYHEWISFFLQKFTNGLTRSIAKINDDLRCSDLLDTELVYIKSNLQDLKVKLNPVRDLFCAQLYYLNKAVINLSEKTQLNKIEYIENLTIRNENLKYQLKIKDEEPISLITEEINNKGIEALITTGNESEINVDTLANFMAEKKYSKPDSLGLSSTSMEDVYVQSNVFAPVSKTA